MTEHSTIQLERSSPQVGKITFTNPPVNLIVAETVLRLAEIVTELQKEADIQVVVFDSGVPDFFFNHFDLAAAADFPVPDREDAVPIWTDIVLKLTKAPYITVASIRGRTRGGGNELALAFDLRYASREKAMFGQPEVGSGLLPSKSFSPALTTTQTPPSDGAGSPVRSPTPNSTSTSMGSFDGLRRSTARRSRRQRRW